MTEAPQPERSNRSQDARVCLALVLLAFIVNVNAVWCISPLGMPHGFVFDDYVLVVDEPAIHSLSPGNLTRIFSATLRDAYRPLRVVSYAIDFAIWGLNPVGYHLINVLLHAVNCALVYILVRMLGGRLLWAAFAAALFAVHPVLSESVAGIAGRKDVLGTFFALSAFLTYVFSTKHSRPAPFYALSLLLFVLAFFTKEVMVAVLGPMVAYEFCFSQKRWLRNILRRQIPFAAAAIGGFIFWRAMTAGHGTLSQHYGLPFAIKGLGDYLRLMFLPMRLSVDYNALPIPDTFLDGTVLLSLIVLVATALLAVMALRKHAWITFAIVWFFAMLFPLSNMLIPVGARLSERYLYAPAVGWCIAIGGLLAALTQRAERVGRRQRSVVATLSILLIALFAIGTMARNRVWRNDRTLWCNAIQTNCDSWLSQNGCGEIYATYLKPIHPNWYRFATPHFLRSAATWPKALSSLVNVAILRGDWQRAEQFARQHTKRQPNDGTAWAALGKTYARQGKWDEALKHYQKAVELSPWEACFWWDIGLIHSHMGEHDAALKFLHKASKVNPTLQDRIAADIGAAYLAKGLYAEAVPPLKDALAADPANVKIAKFLMLAYENLARYGEALAVCNQVMNLSQDAHRALLPLKRFIELKLALRSLGPSTEIFAQLGTAALVAGRVDAAIDYFGKATARDPEQVALKCFLANAYTAKGEFRKAEELLVKAAGLAPRDPSVWLAYAILRSAEGKTDQALDSLRKAIALGGKKVKEYARRTPQFRHLHGDKRFWEMVGRQKNGIGTPQQ